MAVKIGTIGSKPQLNWAMFPIFSANFPHPPQGTKLLGEPNINQTFIYYRKL